MIYTLIIIIFILIVFMWFAISHVFSLIEKIEHNLRELNKNELPNKL